METNDASLPLIRDFQPQAEMFVCADGIRTQQDFVRDLSVVMAELRQLAPSSYLLVLCEDRYHFTLAFCAGLVCDMTNVLPQDRQAETVQKLSAIYDSVITMTDVSIQAMLVNGKARDMTLPSIAKTHLAAIAFTSGSTGVPQANPKSWQMLCGTAQKISQRLLSGFTRPRVLATMPSQHLFGLEMTVMMALQGGAVIHNSKPFFPHDIVDALRSLPPPCVLVSTPVHLRVLVNTGIALPTVAKVISATAPLPRATALAVETSMHTVLDEIYGCTEAGATATRRTACEDHWHLLDGMTLHHRDNQFRVEGDHLPAPACLQDVIEQCDESSFRLLGRSGDMIIVGGKRASLANLNQLLLAIDGIDDALVYLPATQDSDACVRPAAFVVSARAVPDILHDLSASVDPVFLPRPLLKSHVILRNDTGKTTREQLAVMSQRARHD